MEELRAIVASNLIRLRTGAGMTQAELGQMLNYSDKTVSKWERAESMPDAYVLLQLSRIFGITVDELLSSQTTWKTQKELKREQRVVTYDTRAIILVSLAGLWTLALLIFVVFWLLGQVLWQVFPCAVPISLIVYLVLHSIWGRGRYNRYIIMALILSLLVMILPYFIKAAGQTFAVSFSLGLSLFVIALGTVISMISSLTLVVKKTKMNIVAGIKQE